VSQENGARGPRLRVTDEDRETMRVLTTEQYLTRMTEWEYHFVESLRSAATITPRQREILDEIWDRVIR
jgi:hypothetical protein